MGDSSYSFFSRYYDYTVCPPPYPPHPLPLRRHVCLLYHDVDTRYNSIIKPLKYATHIVIYRAVWYLWDVFASKLLFLSLFWFVLVCFIMVYPPRALPRFALPFLVLPCPTPSLSPLLVLARVYFIYFASILREACRYPSIGPCQ